MYNRISLLADFRMSLIGISRDVAALRELTIQEFTKLNREVKELKSKVTTLQRQIHKQSALKHGGLISSPEPDDKTVLYTLSTLALDEVVEDAVASDRTEDTLEALSMETSLEGSTETTEPHCEGGKEAEGSKGLVVGSRSSSKSIDSRRDSFISTVSHVVGNVASKILEVSSYVMLSIRNPEEVRIGVSCRRSAYVH